MGNLAKAVNVLELRRLLSEIIEHRPDICVRFRLIGQMWATNFQRVNNLTEKGVLLNDEASKTLRHVKDLTSVIQFELDKRFQSFEPYFHYDVVVSED